MRPTQFRFLDAAPSLVLGIILIALWEAAIHFFQVQVFVVPAPSAIALSLAQVGSPGTELEFAL